MDIMKDQETLALPLTQQESLDLVYYETIIREGLQTFYEVGNALVTIRNRKLYRGEYRTFEAYCREKWDISRSRAYQLIDAAEIRDDLSTIVDILPERESQARALKAAPPDQRQEVWQAAIEQNNGRPPTAKQIADAIPLPPDAEESPEPVRTASPQVFDRHMQPESKPKPGKKQNFNHGVYSEICEDCGELFDYPVDGPKQTRCETCRFEYYRQKYAPRPDELQGDTEHKKPLDPTLRKYTEEIDDCPSCGRERTVWLKSWLQGEYGIVRQYDIRCQACGTTWTDRHQFEHARSRADNARLEEVHQRHGLLDTPEPEPEPEADEDLSFDERLQRCEALLDKYFDTDKGITRTIEINRTLATLRGVTYPWPPGSQKYAAITANFAMEDLRKEVTREDWERAKQAGQPAPEPELEQRIVCQFCGDAVLERSIYRGKNTINFNGRQACICRTCAYAAVEKLIMEDTFQDYRCPDCGARFQGVAVHFYPTIE